MAQTVVFTNLEVPGASRVGIAEITFTGTTDYATNGVSVLAAIQAAANITILEDLAPVVIGPSLAAGIASFSWDKANNKIKFYTSSTVEVANSGNISTIKAYFYVKGK